RVKGIEASGTLRPFKGVLFSVDYTFLDSKVLSLAPVAIPAASEFFGGEIPEFGVGTPLPFSPQNKLSANLTYTLPLDPELGKLSVGTTWTFVDNTEEYPGAYPSGSIKDYNLVNFNVNWEHIASKPVDAEFFMTNAFNQYYYGVTSQLLNAI